MNDKRGYRAEDIAADLENLGEEIANDTERTLAETEPEDFSFDAWAAMREAIKAMREKLDEMEAAIDRAEDEANERGDAAEGEWESYWD